MAMNESKVLKHELIVGPSGTGKTFLASHCLTYALAKGLCCSVTSLAARRAIQFGGEHLHRFFCLSIDDNLSPSKNTATELKKLNHQPIRKIFLMRLQVLVVEEIGLISERSAMGVN